MKWLLILFLGIVIVPALAQNTPINQTDYQKLETFINDLHVEHKKSDSSVLGLTVISILAGVAVVIIIYIAQSRQSDKIENMTSEVRDFVKKQNKLIDDTRAVYAEAYVSWVQLITFNFESVISWYNDRYLNNPISPSRENTRRTLIDHYERDLLIMCPKIEIMELVKVFGKEVTDKVWISTTHLHAEMWQPYDDNEMSLMIKHYKKYVKKAIDLKDTFLPFCNEHMKTEDQKHNDVYDKIKAIQ